MTIDRTNNNGTGEHVVLHGSSVVIQPHVFDAADRRRTIDLLRQSFNLTSDQAAAIVDQLSPAQAKDLMNRLSGSKNLTREEAKAQWGLSEAELDKLFKGRDTIGVFDSPYSDIFIRFLMLSYSLGMDIKKLIMTCTKLRFDEAITAAEDRLKGAKQQFICNMVAAGLFIAMGGTFLGLNKKLLTSKDPNINHIRAQWMSPITAQQFTQPVSSGGELAKQTEDYNASLHDASAQMVESIIQQLTSMSQSINDADRQYLSAI